MIFLTAVLYWTAVFAFTQVIWHATHSRPPRNRFRNEKPICPFMLRLSRTGHRLGRFFQVRPSRRSQKRCRNLPQ